LHNLINAVNERQQRRAKRTARGGEEVALLSRMENGLLNADDDGDVDVLARPPIPTDRHTPYEYHLQ
jgi:hypothetical protein